MEFIIPHLPPYHPASNGLAERAVQIIKKGLKKITNGSINTRLARVLLAYPTPQSTTGLTPAEMLCTRSQAINLVGPYQTTSGRESGKKATATEN